MFKRMIYKGGKEKLTWISKTGLLTSSEMENNANYWHEYYTGNPPTPTPPTPGKGVPKEIIAILSSKRGLHKL